MPGLHRENRHAQSVAAAARLGQFCLLAGKEVLVLASMRSGRPLASGW